MQRRPKPFSKSTNQPNLLAMNAYWLGLSFMWNAIHPLILPTVLLQMAEPLKNTAYGLLTFAGLLVALVTQPISGALSDYTRTPWGRRRPWMVAGTLIDVFWLLAMVTSHTLWGVAISYIGLQLSSNIAHGPAQGLIPDLVQEGNRGAASGIKSLLEIIGIILAALTVSRLVGKASLLTATLLVIAVLLITLGVTVLGIRERPFDTLKASSPFSLGSQIRQVFDIRFRENEEYARLLLARFCILLGSYTLQSFALYYFSDVLKIKAPANMVGNLMMVIGLSVLLSVYPAGVLSERYGRKPLTLAACSAFSIGAILLALMRHPNWIWVLGILIGVGVGIFSSVNWAWATDLVPFEEAGKYLGLSNLATAGSAASSRLLGPFIDLLNRYAPGMGYRLIFIVSVMGALAGLWITSKLPEPRRNVHPHQSTPPTHPNDSFLSN